MKVSILIPFYNVSSFIERALLSVLDQTYSEIECVLVDDGSTDDSYLKVLSIINTHPQGNLIHLFRHEKNQGIATTRNTCIAKATGDYIFFLDSDDELPNRAIEGLVLVAKAKNVDLVIGDFEITNGNRSNFPSIHHLSAESTYHASEVFNSFLELKVTDMPCMKLVRRKVLMDSGISFYPGIVHEDTLWVFSLMLNLQSMAVSDSICYVYHFRQGSITQEKSDRNFVSLLIVMQRILRIAMDGKLFDSYPLLMPYLNNLRYYMLKEMVRIKLGKAYIEEKFQEINRIFSVVDRKPHQVFSLSDFLRKSFFSLPFEVSIFFMKMVLLLKHKSL